MANRASGTIKLSPRNGSAAIYYQFKGSRHWQHLGFPAEWLTPLLEGKNRGFKIKWPAKVPIGKVETAKEIFENIELKWKNVLKELSKQDITPTVENFRKVLNGCSRTDIALGKVIEAFLRHQETQIKPSSYFLYLSTLTRFREYCESTKTSLDDINQSWCADYITHLRKTGLSTNSMFTTLARVKCFLFWSLKAKYHKNDDFYYLRVKLEQRDHIALSDAEIQAFLNAKLPPKHSIVRDSFILCGAMGGQRVSDWSQFDIARILEEDGFKFMPIVQTKNRRGRRATTSFVPMTPVMIFLLERLGGTVPSFGTHAASKVREAARLSGVFNDLIRVNGEIKPKWAKVLSHTGRRSFVTGAFEAGISVSDIGAVSGHAPGSASIHVYNKSNGLASSKRFAQTRNIFFNQ